MAESEAPAADVPGGLLERAEELRLLEGMLDATSEGEASLTVLAASAGMGKTKLLEAALAGAAEVGVSCLQARASELERDFAFGVVRQLVESAVVTASPEERAELLAGPARHAAAVLDLEADPDLDRDPLTTIHGLYWLLANLSARSPLLVAVDDLQWVDDPSLRWLAYLVRRLDRLPIAVLLTLREDDAGAAELPASSSEGSARAVEEILAQEPALRLRPRALSQEAVAALLEQVLGEPGEPEFAAACRERTAGNPFLLSELLVEIAADGLAPRASSLPELERIVPQRLGEATRRHLARLSPEARALAEAVAVLGETEDPHLGAELAELDSGAAAAAELVREQVFEDGPVFRFRHPLLRAAVEAGIPTPQRASRHARAARLLAERGAATARVTPHLLLSPPGAGDEWAVERLRAAARSARSQGAPDQAIALLERALAEPPPEAERGAILAELAHTELASLGPGMAVHFAAARELVSEPKERAALATGHGLALYFKGGHAEAVESLLAAIDEVADVPELREEWLQLETVLAMAGRYDLETEARVRGRAAALAATLDGSTPGERLVQAIAAGEEPGDTAADLARATDLQVRAQGALPVRDPSAGIGSVAMYLHAGRPDAAEALSERMVAEAADEGSPLRYAMGILCRGFVALDRGDLRAAESELEAALTAISELGAETVGRISASPLIVTLAQRGSLERAAELLAEYELDGELPERMLFNPALFGRGMLRLEQRRFGEAEADFRELGRRHERWGMTRPSPPWRSACALALVGAGDRQEAARLATAELELTRRWDTPKAIAISTRALGLASEGERALELLGEAVELLEGTPWRLDRARARCDFGAALRRDGQRRRGREALALAMDEANACGAEPLAELAAEELKASGARPRRRAISGLDALTPAERRVASLAASGRTNREIAQEIFVTIATVETHLTRVYRKLDLDGRDGLAGALGAGQASDD